MKLKRVTNEKDLTNSLLLANNAEEGDICIAEDTRNCFIRQNDQWMPYIPSISGKGPEIPLYELNRSIMRQQKEYNADEMKKFINDFNEYAKTTNNKYYMLLSVETSYYTIFVHEPEQKNDLKNLGSALLAVSLAIGPIIGHDIEDDHIEIWYRDKNDNEAYCYMLFPYDGGVVSFG